MAPPDKKQVAKPKLKPKPQAAAPPADTPPSSPPPSKPVKVKTKGPAAPPSKTAAGFAKPEVMMPTSPTAVLNNLIARETTTPSGPLEPVSETVNTLVKLTNAMSRGEDISGIKNDIVRISSHQPEKAEVYQSVLNLINQERVTDAVVSRATVEKVLKRSAKRGDLSTSECLAVWEISNNIIRDHESKAAKQNKPVDTVTSVDKVDFQTIEFERIVQEKWEGTTPQGRQIIRMKLFDLKRKILAEKASSDKNVNEDESEEAENPTIEV
jgi:hypothetical protein